MLRAALGCLVCVAAAAPAQQAPDLARALAVARAAPLQSRQALPDPADSRDDAVLRRTLYGDLAVEELTEAQATEMVAAATRKFERRKAAVERAGELVEEGVMARLALTPLIEELDRSRRVVDLAASRASLIRELGEIARREIEELLQAGAPGPGPRETVSERYDGLGFLRGGDFHRIAQAFEQEFARTLPVSARGATALHRSLGFDHRGRYDVALDPDAPEGVWLRGLLQSWRIPYFAFRAAVRGRATGPHIHIGPPSERAASGG